MEDNFRNVLIILSAIVIIAIFIHGLWTIRKQKNPYKLKAPKDKIAPITRDFDRTGFDQDGVSQVKVTKADKKSSQTSEDKADASLSDVEATDRGFAQSQVLTTKDVFSKTSEINVADIESSTVNNTDSEPLMSMENEHSLSNLDGSVENDWFKEDAESNSRQFSKDELGDELTPVSEVQTEISDSKLDEPETTPPIEPLYEQPVTQAKPKRTPIKKAKKPLSKAELKRDQIEIDFDNQLEQSAVSTPINKGHKKVELEPQVIILSVVMPASQQMFGAALLPTLLTLGLKFGDMNIFHRHEDNAGNGKVTFSLANILNPGTFDLDSMETFATRGVSLFMTLPNAGDSFAVFEQMLNAAKQLAQEFNAQVLDDKRNVLTKQSEQHYLSKIREFDRKSRIALVE